MRTRPRNKIWTDEEYDYMLKALETKSVKHVARRLNRSYQSVLQKFNDSGYYVKDYSPDITATELAEIVNKQPQTIAYWIRNKELPAKKQGIFWRIPIESFWEWAKENPEFIDVSVIEENILLPEPSWVKEKRLNKEPLGIKTWTDDEVGLLRNLLLKTNLTLKEIAKELNRTEASVRKKGYSIGMRDCIRGRSSGFYSKTEEDYIIKSLKEGKTTEEIAKTLNRSESGLIRKIKKLKNK